MAEFLYLYRWAEGQTPSPDQMEQQMQKWIAWMKGMQDKGHIKDRGHPLEASGKLVRGKEKLVVDGPYTETKEIIGGYTLIEADDLAQAAELAKGCPILAGGGTVEVRPIKKM